MSYPQGQYPDPNQQPWGSPQQGSGYGNQGYPQQGGGYHGQDPYSQPQPDPYGQPQPDPYGQPQPDPYAPQPGYQQPGYPPTSGSPYGPTSGSPYGPASGVPYAQPTQPQYPGYGEQQPGYSQPGVYGQPGGYGQYGAPTPPPQKSRTPLIIGVVVLAILVLCGAGATVYFVTKGDSTTIADPTHGPSATSTTRGSSTGPTAGRTTGGTTNQGAVTFTAPNTIGSYTKAADDGTATSMKSQMQASGIADPFTAVYEDSSGRAVIWGGAGSAFGGSADTQLNGFFSSAAKSLNGTLGPRVTADAGSLGGKAQCSKVNGTGLTMSLCAWSGSNALLGFIFTNISPETAAGKVKTILPAVVVKP